MRQCTSRAAPPSEAPIPRARARSNPPLVEASEAFAQQFPRSIVATPPVIGEGPNFRIVPLVQFITMPQYLLLGHLPAITSDFTDYELVQRQVTAFRDMARSLSKAPAEQLGVSGP